MTASAAAQFLLYCRRRRGSPPTFPSGAAPGRERPGLRLRSGQAVPERPGMRREAASAPRLAARLPSPLPEPGARTAATRRSLRGTAGRAASPCSSCFGIGGQRPRGAAAAPHAAPVRPSACPSIHLCVGGGSCVRGCVWLTVSAHSAGAAALTPPAGIHAGAPRLRQPLLRPLALPGGGDLSGLAAPPPPSCG